MLTFDLRKEWRLIFQCMIDHLPMNAKEEHLRYWPSGGRVVGTYSLPLQPGSNLFMHTCHPRDALITCSLGL
jgi:hypothetical protein